MCLAGCSTRGFTRALPSLAAPGLSSTVLACAACPRPCFLPQVLSFWTYYRGCGYEKDAMAQWVAQVRAGGSRQGMGRRDKLVARMDT